MADDLNRGTYYDWWNDRKDEAHSKAYDAVKYLYNNNKDRMERNLRCLRLYGNASLAGVSPYSVSQPVTAALPENRVKINIVASMCDTVTAKIAQMKPKVTFLTNGADWLAQDKAKKLDQYMYGWVYRNNLHQMHQTCFRDATIMDIGALKHFIQGNTIVSERVLATELLADDVDGMYGKPRCRYHFKYVHKEVLGKQYPKKKPFIMSSAASLEASAFVAKDMANHVVVIEAWALESEPGAGDGRHIIFTDQVTLVDEEYNKNYFPFTFFYWSKPVTGVWGQSLADRLTGNQVEINKMLRIIQKSFHLGSAFKVFVEHGSRIVREHINNEIGSLVYYTGTKPEYLVPKTVHQEFFSHLEWLIRNSYEEAGVSQLSATSRKPSGLDSGKALREYNDIETERFAIVSQDFEKTYLETAEIYLDLSRDLAEAGVELEVTGESKRFLDSIKWNDIAVKGNEYVMQMYPTNMLPNTPAGRLAWVQEMMNAQLISADEGLMLLDYPDIKGYFRTRLAVEEDLRDTADRILVRGEYTPPEPFQNLDKAIPFMQLVYLDAKKRRAPEDRMDMLIKWIATADAMLQKAKAAQAAMVPPAPGGPAPIPQNAPGTEAPAASPQATTTI